MAERKRTNAEIDMLNSFLKEGQTPLPYEFDDQVAPIENTTSNTPESIKESTEEKVELTEEEQKIIADKEKEILSEEEKNKKSEDEKQKEIAQVSEEEKSNILLQNEPKQNEVTQDSELDEEKILAFLKNKTGKEISSLDELLNPKQEPTEEEKKAAAEKRDADKISFGLSKGIFTKKQLEEFITDTKNPKEFVFAHYAADQKAKDSTLTDEEIKEEFEEKFSINEDVESRQYKVGQDLLNNIANNLLNKKHSKILNLENDYSAFEKEQSTQKEREAKLTANTATYKKDVEQIRNDIQKVSLNVGNNVFETALPKEAIDKVITNMLNPNYANTQIASGWNKETLKQVAHTSAIIENLPYILEEYGNAQVLKHQAGVRGVMPDKVRGQRVQAGELTDRQKQALSYLKGETVAN